jgi:hypothetical protein
MRLKTPIALLSAGALAAGVTACGSSTNNNSRSGSSSSSAAPRSGKVKPLAEITSLSGKSTSVKLDTGFVSALSSLKVQPGTVGDAKLTSGGSAVFPITGGTVKYFKPGSVSPYVQGEIDHDGSGLSLTAGATKVDLENFVVDPGKSQLTGKVTVNGKTAAPSAPLFFLDGRTLQPLKVNKGNGTAVLEGTTVKLTQAAADLLNKTFKVTALKKNLVIGVAKITVNTA